MKEKERKRISEALLIGLLDEYLEKWHEVDQSWNDLRSSKIGEGEQDFAAVNPAHHLQAGESKETAARQ